MIEIIQADKSHFEIIKNIASNTWPDTFGDILSESQINYMLDMMYSLDSLNNQIEKLNHTFLLAKEDQNNYGYLSYELDYKNESKTKIHKIYILPKTQGKGIGKKLIDRLTEIALNNNQKVLALNVNRFNKAVGFYQKIGFEIIGQENIDIGDGFLMEDFIMEKVL